jgi:hypothetical protein
MEYWYVITLGDGVTAVTPQAELEAAFRRAFQVAGYPAEMAVFTRLESDGRLHCEVKAYFSPAARAVSEAFEAEPCPKPERTGLGLLAGDPHAWEVLFPESAG